MITTRRIACLVSASSLVARTEQIAPRQISFLSQRDGGNAYENTSAHLIESPLRAGVNAVGEMLRPQLKVVGE